MSVPEPVLSPDQEPQLNVAANPHWRDGSSLAGTQGLWLAALLPAAAAGVLAYGLPALRVLCLACSAAVIWDALANRLLPGKDHTTNLSSLTLGLQLGLLLPVDAPWWLVAIGAFLTVVVGKKIFGGWGGYPVHPVALSFAMLSVSWPARLDYTASLAGAALAMPPVEPLRLVKTLGPAAEGVYGRLDLLLGNQVAGIGSGMVLYLAIGGIFLVLVRQVPWQIPAGAIAGVAGCAVLLGAAAGGRCASPPFHLLAGSTALTVFFLLGEHTTSPVNPRPMFAFGLLAGALLVLIRTFSDHVDGGIFAVLLADLAAPLLDRWAPRVRGAEVASHA